jgi:hypothetical protein
LKTGLSPVASHNNNGEESERSTRPIVSSRNKVYRIKHVYPN